MTIQRKELRLYAFAFSNFLAAFGGGTILGKGIDAANISFLHGGSILAFLIGTVFGLVFLQFIPKSISEPIARWFSILGAFTSLLLFFIFKSYAVNEKLIGFFGILFFFLMCVRFGFWFYSRVLRASNVAGQEQNIAWVELGYYFGMISGLIIWKFEKINILLPTALIIDSFLQFSAGILDIWGTKLKKYINEKPLTLLQKENANNLKHLGWRLIYALVFLTIGTQVIIFKLAHQVSVYFSPYILAFFYIGVAVAAFMYKKLKIRFDWNENTNRGCTIIVFRNQKKDNCFNFLSIKFFILLILTLIICKIDFFFW